MEGAASHVTLATLALLSYRLLFYSTHELSITSMLFCCVCALCVGQLVAVALGQNVRESVLFIGTQFSILYTSMYSPAEAATPRA